MSITSNREHSPTLAITVRRKGQHGFTLIEILVTLVILAIGLLGMASLQLNGLRSNQSAYLKSQASLLAYDMADRMRLNSDRAIAGDYNSFDTSDVVAANPNCISTATGCTETQQVATDKAEWAEAINGSGSAIAFLPKAKGEITRAVGGNVFTITVSWTETTWDEDAGSNQATDYGQSFAMNFSL